MTVDIALGASGIVPAKDKVQQARTRFAAAIPWVILIVLTAFLGYVALNFRFDHDELEAIHTAWKMSQGERIYVDFFQHHHPLWYYCLSPMIRLLGEGVSTLIAIRVLMFFVVLAVLFVTALLAWTVYGKGTMVFALLLLLTKWEFAFRAVEARPDIPQTLLGLISVLLLLRYFDCRRTWVLGLSAVCLAFSFLFLQKTVFLCFLMGAVLLYSVLKREIHVRTLVFFCAVFVGSAAILLLPVIYMSGLRAYIDLNWLLNMKCLNHFSPFKTIWPSLTSQRSLFFWPVCFAGLVFCLKTANQKRVAFIAAGLFLSIFCVRAPYGQYLIPSYPLLAVIGAASIARAYNWRKTPVLVGIVLAVALWFSAPLVGKPLLWSTNADDLRGIDYIMNITERSDCVLDGVPEFNIFRKDISFFWYSIGKEKSMLATYRTMKTFPFDVADLVEAHRPKVVSTVLLPDEILEMPQIKDHYLPDSHYPKFLIRTD